MYHLARLSLSLQAIICLTFLSQNFWAQSNSLRPAPGTVLEILGSNRTQDGLRGAVESVRTEAARLSLRAGKLTEGPHTLLEVTRYDERGNRIENATYYVPVAGARRATCKYDHSGNITEKLLSNARGQLISRTVYTYEFDAFGNWTKMIASEAGGEAPAEELSPTEVTYRTISYYASKQPAPAVGPEPSKTEADATAQLTDAGVLNDRALSLPAPAFLITGRHSATPILITVAVVVDETGRVSSAKATGGPAQLQRAAEAAARLAGFLPFRDANKRPVKVRGLLRYSFAYQP